MPSLFFEDVEIGARYQVPGRPITQEDIALFATLSGDDHPIHTDAAYAASTPFGRCIAHGPFGIALAMGMFGRIEDFRATSLALTDIGDWRFKAPVYAGDVLDLDMVVTAKRLTRSGAGVIDRQMRLVKQDGTVAQEGSCGLLMAKRP